MAEPVEGDFEPATENAALVELLRRRIEATGPITFHDYMETVLYHPELGSYPPRRYRIVGISPSLRRRQEETLGALAELVEGQVEWLDELPEAFEGCLL